MSEKPPELTFQDHIAKFLKREHGYGELKQHEITDTEHAIAEDHLWKFLNDSQPDTVKKLADDYGTDARGEVFRELKDVLRYKPLWLVIRDGLEVRDCKFQLYYAPPRSRESAGHAGYLHNRITFRPHFYFGETNKEIDLVLFLNGLPIVAMELKHDANQTVHDAVAQFVKRDHTHKIFQHPFLYLAAGVAQVKAATDPRREENFRWHNTGLTNTATNPGEYPVEFLYREVLSRDQLLEALSFFLVYVPKREAEDDKAEMPAFTLFPRYHQSRMVRKVADDAAKHFAATGNIGRKFLINHSAGSGKTLSICWLAERLHSLFKPGTNEKLVDIVFVLTDRTSLNKNIADDFKNFTHLKDVVVQTRDAKQLEDFLDKRKSIVVTTQQKFGWILDKIVSNPKLKSLRVAFLIDEAHRSQEGKMGVAIRTPFRKTTDADVADAEAEPEDEEDEIARIIREHDLNQLFVAFTATPAPATVELFGEPFDTYTEREAIDEGYILDVATSIVSFKTLYNLQSGIVPKPGEAEKLYPKGILSKALMNVAFQDDELIQYKSEVMLRIFESDVKSLIGRRAKAMIVTSSRLAGLRYFEILKEKLKERGADYKVLYAFSDFLHPTTGKEIREHEINELKPGEAIEDRFEGDDYRLMVVASKFQTGFDQPLLAGMFLDKPVVDRNAVQTVSRLNRCHAGKDEVVVVDFTNNVKTIFKAFAKYRFGTPSGRRQLDQNECVELHAEILAEAVFTQADASDIVKLIQANNDPDLQSAVERLKQHFEQWISNPEERKGFVSLLGRFVHSFNYLSCFFTYPPEIQEFAVFAEYVSIRLIEKGRVSELMKLIRQTYVSRGSVEDLGTVTPGTPQKPKSGKGGGGGGPPLGGVSIQEMLEEIREKFPISDDEALVIREVTDEKSADPEIHATVIGNRENRAFLDQTYRGQVRHGIRQAYEVRQRFDETADPQIHRPWRDLRNHGHERHPTSPVVRSLNRFWLNLPCGAVSLADVTPSPSNLSPPKSCDPIDH